MGVKYRWLKLCAISFVMVMDSLRPAHAGLILDPNNMKVRGRLWPNRTVPYVIQPGFNQSGLSNIMAAIQEFNTKTVMKIIPRTSEEHYLVFTPWNSMNGESAIGMQLGPQALMMDAGVWLGTAMHELGHAVGLYHEHNRMDVTQYFKYVPGDPNYAFCQSEYLGTQESDAVMVGTYDYLSIMNYFTGCVMNIPPVIVRTQTPYSQNYYNNLYVWGSNGFRMGTNLSPGDVAAINTLYANPPAQQNWDYTSCIDTPDDPGQCSWMLQNGSCTSFSTQEGSYDFCPATCGICKTNPNGGGNNGGNGGGNNNGGNGGGNNGGGNGGGNACADTSAADFCLFGATINLCSTSTVFNAECAKTCGCDGSAIPTVMTNAQGVADNVNCRYWATSRCDNTVFVQNACPASCTTYDKYRSQYQQLTQ